MRDIETNIVFCNSLQSPLGYVSSAGFIKNSGGVSNDPMRILGNYAFVYVLNGGGRYEDENGVELEVRRGDLILISPDVAHAYGPRDGETWDELHAVFGGAIFDLWRQSGLWNELAPVVHLEPIDFWFKRLEAIFDLARSSQRNGAHNSHSDIALQQIGALQHIFADALAESRSLQKMSVSDAQWLALAREKLISSTRYQLRSDTTRSDTTLENVARAMNVSYENFRKKFVALSGVAPGQFRLSQQMNRACALLYETDLRHKEIARQLGFCDEYYFSRQFKKTVGCSPQQFRKRMPAR